MLVLTVTSLSAAGAAPAQPARIGHALVVGAAGFAWCSLALGLVTTGAMNAAGGSLILSGTFFYGGLVQLVAGFFALASGATFVAAFLTAYGAFWLGYTAIQQYLAPHIVSSVLATAGGTPAQAGHDVAQALGMFLIAWLVVTVIFTIASLGTNAVTVLAFVLLDLTIVLLTTAYLGASSAGVASSATLHAAGWVEILLAAVAFYIVLAELANETLRRAIFPLFPLARPDTPAATAVAGA